MANLYAIPFKHLDAVIEKARPEIEKAVEAVNGLVPAEAMIEGVLSGQKDLWCILDDEDQEVLAWAVSEYIGDVAFIWCVGGKQMEAWIETQREFGEHAKELGCRAVQFYGRPGWQRALKEEGYKVRQVVMEKEL